MSKFTIEEAPEDILDDIEASTIDIIIRIGRANAEKDLASIIDRCRQIIEIIRIEKEMGE